MTSWNLGLTKESDPRVAKQSQSLKMTISSGRHKTDWAKGKHWNLSRETKQRQSEAKKKLYKDGWVNPLSGKKQSDDFVQKRISAVKKYYEDHISSMKGRSLPRDSDWYKKTAERFRQMASKPKEKNGRWRGGISFEPYSSNFDHSLKISIKERDSYICQLCGKPESWCTQKLCIHHIDYDKKNSQYGNLITLCHPCNSKANADRDKWVYRFKEMLKVRGIIG